jgi:glycine/D-amino acid oxidase-like deaminating enzyme
MYLSYWEKQHFFNKSDLVVIGSGIVGLNAAISFKLKFPNKKVTVIERGILPSGASTRNAGFACIGSVSELSDDLTKMSEQNVWETVNFRYSGLKKLRSLVGDENMDYQHLGGYEVFDSEESFDINAAKIDKYNSFLKPITGLNETFKINHSKIIESRMKGFRYCIENLAEGQINTGLMMRKLLDVAYHLGILIFNHIDVSSINDTNNEVEINCKNNLILKSDKVIVATNGFAKELLNINDVEPARAQVLITKPILGLSLKGSFHYDSGYYYFRNIDDRILFGGGRNLDFAGENTSKFGLSDLIQNQLDKLLSENIVPHQQVEIDLRWSGIMGVGSEKKPIIQFISNNVVCAVRMGGMGVAIGSLVGEMASSKLFN